MILLVTYQSLVFVFSQSAASLGAVSTIVTQVVLVALAVAVVFLAFRKGGKYQKALVVLVVVSLLVWIPLTLPLTLQSGLAPERLVGAYYYVWYGTAGKDAEWQNYEVFTLPDEPLLGRYLSSDENVVTQHLTWAKDYGIDFFAVSLWKSNFMPVEDTFDNTKLLFETNRQLENPVKLCVMIEPVIPSELDMLADEAWSLVGYEGYLCWHGKPLLLVYTSYIGQFAQWRDSRFTVKFIPTEAPYFPESIQTYVVGDTVCVTPGANVSYIQVDRQNGKYYIDQWAFAVNWGKLNPHRDLIVTITSFNEFYEATQLEPCKNWDDPLLYLKITKEYSDIFRRIW